MKQITSHENLNNEEIKFRTDNPAETFHKELNPFIHSHKPKLPFFLVYFK